jgi:hypothetical protein
MIFVCLCGFWSHLWRRGEVLHTTQCGAFHSQHVMPLLVSEMRAQIHELHVQVTMSICNLEFCCFMIRLPVLRNSKSLVQCTPSTFSSKNMSDFNLEYGISNQFILNELETVLYTWCFQSDLLCTVQGARCQVYRTSYTWLISLTCFSVLLSYTLRVIKDLYIHPKNNGNITSIFFRELPFAFDSLLFYKFSVWNFLLLYICNLN